MRYSLFYKHNKKLFSIISIVFLDNWSSTKLYFENVEWRHCTNNTILLLSTNLADILWTFFLLFNYSFPLCHRQHCSTSMKKTNNRVTFSWQCCLWMHLVWSWWPMNQSNSSAWWINHQKQSTCSKYDISHIII